VTQCSSSSQCAVGVSARIMVNRHIENVKDGNSEKAQLLKVLKYLYL